MIKIIFLLFCTYSFAFIDESQKNEALQFFWNENNSMLQIEPHTYIRNLAKKIDKDNNYDFFIIRDNQINAFATEFGLIGINQGLINLTENEAELAAVLAHEIAHIKLNHFARFKQKNEYNDLLAIGGVLLAGVVNNSELSQALWTGGIAGSLQMQINFTREHEVEADNYGKKLLKKSGFNPAGMSSFFAKLQKMENSENAIEFLRTHPLSKNRAANSLDFKSQKFNNSLDYLLLKSSLGKDFKSSKLDKYFRANNLFAKNKLNDALNVLKNPANKTEKLLKSQILATKKNLKAAIKLLQDDDYLTQYYLANAYFINQKYQKSIEILKQQNSLKPDFYNYNLIVKNYLKQGKQDKYFYTQGLKYLLIGSPNRAKQQFILAKNITNNKDLFDVLTYKISKLK